MPAFNNGEDGLSIRTKINNGITSGEAHISSSSGVHGITGDVVGTSGAQTISGKTFTGTISLSTQNTIYGDNGITQATGNPFSLNTGSASGDGFVVNNFQLIVESDTGNVGIGTATPAAKLHIEGSSANLLIDSTSGNAIILVDSNTTSDDSEVQFRAGLSTKGKILYDHNATASSEKLYFNVGGAAQTRMTINGSGNVGIGTATPDGTLHAHTGSAGTVTAVSGADDLIIENSSQGGISILTPDANQSNIVFGSPSSANAALIGWKYTDNLMSIGTTNASAELRLLYGDSNEGMRIDSSGNVGVGAIAPNAKLDVDNSADSLALRVDRAGTTVTDSIAEFVSNSGGANTTNCKILVDGDLENTNNSYGAISDEKLKQDILPASGKLSELMQVNVVNYALKNNPDVKLIGVIAQEIEQIWPGIVRETPDYEEIPDPLWTPAPERTIKRQVTEDVTSIVEEIQLIDGKYTSVRVTKTEKVSVMEDVPLHDESGDVILESVSTGELDSEGNEVFTDVVKTIQIPVMEDVTIPAETEDDRPKILAPTGETTKSVKYSVLVPMLVKALQELHEKVIILENTFK